MEAKFEEVGETMMVVHLRGRIDLESIEPFVNCLDNLKNYQVIFNMQGLSFVGSNGISTFVDSMRDLARESSKAIKFCCVSSEFRRIFTATLAQDIEIHEDIHRAQLAFQPRTTEPHGGFNPYYNQPQAKPQYQGQPQYQAQSQYQNQPQPQSQYSNQQQTASVPPPPVAVSGEPTPQCPVIGIADQNQSGGGSSVESVDSEPSSLIENPD